MRARSLNDQLLRHDGRPSGFDYLRIVLATAVVAWHTIGVTQGFHAEAPYWAGPLRPLVYIIVPSFFALSGFLVAGSLERNDLGSFLTLRALRIIPALAVEVAISALIIGPLLTTVSRARYFSDPRFYLYFLNITGDIHYLLPGLFVGNPAGRLVNVQLWTVPFELKSYLAISIIAMVGLYKRPRTLIVALLALCVEICLSQTLGHKLPPLASRPPGDMIVLCFLFGVCIYALRTKIAFNRSMLIGSLVASWLFLSFTQTTFLAPFPVAYFTVYIGLLNPERLFVIRGADYSYGLYLYGFPVQQSLYTIWPLARIWYCNFLLSLVVAGCLALLSWTFVESKALHRRRFVLNRIARLRAVVMSRFKATPAVSPAKEL